MITGTYNAVVCLPNFYSFHFDKKLKKGELFTDNNALVLPRDYNTCIEHELLYKEINYKQIDKFIKQVETDLEKYSSTVYL